MNVNTELQSPVTVRQMIYVKVLTTVVVGLSVVIVVVHCDEAIATGVAKVNEISKTTVKSKCVIFLPIVAPPN